MVEGFTGPARFAECRFEGSITPADFRIGIRDASTPDLEELTPPVVTAVVTAE